MPASELRSTIAERREAEELCLLEQFARARRAAQEREMRGDLELGIGHREDPVQPPAAAAIGGRRPRKSQKRAPRSVSTR